MKCIEFQSLLTGARLMASESKTPDTAPLSRAGLPAAAVERVVRDTLKSDSVNVFDLVRATLRSVCRACDDLEALHAAVVSLYCCLLCCLCACGRLCASVDTYTCINM